MDKIIKQLVENGVRIHVTSRCNISCIFCHNEGQNYRASVERKDDIINNDLLIKFINYGVRIFTFTGGEPLMYYSQLKNTLDMLAGLNDQNITNELDITLVTNGILLNEERVQYFKSFSQKIGKFKFNVSLHTYDRELYKILTQKGDYFDKVINNLRLLDKYNINYKINYVLLKTRNSKEEILENMFRFSVENKIKNIKIIEMLVTEFNKEFYHEFHEISPLIFNLRHRAKKQIIDSRKAVYILKDLPLNVEIIRCTCTIGCEDCLKNREIEISNNSYKPCFISDKKYYIDEETSIESIYNNVIKDITEIAKRYGRSSPSLILKNKLIPERYIFQLDINDEIFDRLWNTAKIRTYKELTIIDYRHPFEEKLNSPYTFYLEIPAESPEHTKIVSSKKIIESLDGIKFLKEEFLDKIYHFAQSKKTVCEKKLEAMNYQPHKSNYLKFDIINLSEYEETPDDLVLLKRVISDSQVFYVVEITTLNPLITLNKIIEEKNINIKNYNIKDYIPIKNI